MSLLRRLAHPIVAIVLIREGMSVIRHPEPHADKAAPLVSKIADKTNLPDDPERFVRASGAALVACGGLVALGNRLPRLTGGIAAGLLGPITVFGYPFWKTRGRRQRAAARQGFWYHLALLGAALLVTADRRPDTSHGLSTTVKAARAGRRAAKKSAKTLAE